MLFLLLFLVWNITQYEPTQEHNRRNPLSYSVSVQVPKSFSTNNLKINIHVALGLMNTQVHCSEKISFKMYCNSNTFTSHDCNNFIREGV